MKTSNNPRHVRLWTSDEDAQLFLLYGEKRPLSEIAAQLNRTEDAVGSRVRYLRQMSDEPILAPYFKVRKQRQEPRSVSITSDDLAWMEYWKQPRIQRKRQEACA